jgi:hypothetical protein
MCLLEVAGESASESRVTVVVNPDEAAAALHLGIDLALRGISCHPFAVRIVRDKVED